MPDAWTLVTPNGNLTLNPTFAATKYEPGSVDGNAAARREGQAFIQRVGDGRRTPGPLVLRGAVWRDDHDQQAMRTELTAIETAVQTAVEVQRINTAGTYTYSDLAGGPTIAVTPDGISGWRVEIELWPARAEAVFVPGGGGGPVEVLAAAVHILEHPTGTYDVPVPGGTAPPGALIILVLASGNGDVLTGAAGWTNLNGQNNIAPLEDGDMTVWAFQRTASGGEATVSVESSAWLWGTAHIVILTGGGTADVQVHTGLHDSLPTITGSASVAGLQLVMGGLSEIGLS